MAHKIHVKPVPHINRDGSKGKKTDYRVICKRRGHVCTDETFGSKEKAQKHVDDHWLVVNDRKNRLSLMLSQKRDIERALKCRVSIRAIPDIADFRGMPKSLAGALASVAA